MGGCCCCCASKGVELNSSPPFYHYPVVAEEREPLSSHHGTASALSTGLLVDTNLDTSIPDTYRPPPAPMPYETHAGNPRTPQNQETFGNKSEITGQTRNCDSVNEANTAGAIEPVEKVIKESGDKDCTDVELAEIKEVVDELEKSGELKKSNEPFVPLEEEECCPTCLEEYDAENPKIITKCEHHFHLACILEWMERSDTCPVCDQEMIFNLTSDA